METVNRLAASVRPRSTSHDNSPALLRTGNASVDTMAEQTSKNPIAEIPIRKALLFQVLLSVISMRVPHSAGLMSLGVNQPSYGIKVKLSDNLEWACWECLLCLAMCQQRLALLTITVPVGYVKHQCWSAHVSLKPSGQTLLASRGQADRTSG